MPSHIPSQTTGAYCTKGARGRKKTCPHRPENDGTILTTTNENQKTSFVLTTGQIPVLTPPRPIYHMNSKVSKSGENSATTTIAGTGSVRGRHRITLNAPIEFSQVINCCPTTTMDAARVITITQKTKNIVRNMNRSIRKR